MEPQARSTKKGMWKKILPDHGTLSSVGKE